MNRLALDDTGRGAPVLLVHGFPTSRRLWLGVIPQLVQAGRRVIAVDLAGYGDSPGAAVDVALVAEALRDAVKVRGEVRTGPVPENARRIDDRRVWK